MSVEVMTVEEPEEEPPEPIKELDVGVETPPEKPPPKVQPEVIPEQQPSAPDDAPPPEPVNFDGLTLSNEGDDSSWSVQQSSGKARKEPLAAPAPPGVPGGTGSGPVLVPVGKLKRRPVPPSNLNDVLLKNYPAQAKRQGIEGVARVRVRLMPDGRPRPMAVISQTATGFGAACKRTLRASPSWRPALDQKGQPVATEITFTCNFEVRY